ncbi:hypothetical protein BH10PSE19_BH10PSE19_02260 [soil metagenome]
MKIEIEFYGQTKDIFNSVVEILHFNHSVNITEIKAALLLQVKKDYNLQDAENLLHVCALATASEILPSHFIVSKELKLALLPPVSGG